MAIGAVNLCMEDQKMSMRGWFPRDNIVIEKDNKTGGYALEIPRGIRLFDLTEMVTTQDLLEESFIKLRKSASYHL